MSAPTIISIMGLAGAGKTTTAKALAKELKARGEQVIIIDGDEFRGIFGLGKYDKASRIAYTAQRTALCIGLAKQDFIVINAIISLFNESYEMIKDLTSQANIKHKQYYLKCPIDELEKRDQKELYSKAKAGKMRDVVGVDIGFDEPNADLVCDGTACVDENVKKIIKDLGL